LGVEGEKVVPVNEAVVEEVSVRDPVRRMIRLVSLLQQDAPLQPRPVLPANPGEFEYCFLDIQLSVRVLHHLNQVDLLPEHFLAVMHTLQERVSFFGLQTVEIK
jgi:hypothetical protein